MAFIVRGSLRSLSKALLKPPNTEFVAVRCISGKTSGLILKDRPKPYDYINKRYNPLMWLVDKTTSRFNENTKVVVVDGPIASGKSKVAKGLAEEFDMLYFPEANMDMININPYGFDMRKLDAELPERVRIFDLDHFLKNPKSSRSLLWQIEQYRLRYSQYIDALAHLLSTGQGVVMDRSPYSDFVFAEAMARCGYITKSQLKCYYEYRNNAISELMRPHLVIYLDVPVDKTIENIKKRNNILEVKSPIVNKTYLQTMEDSYKQGYLKEMSKYAEMLIYDWSEPGDLEIIVEDIERIDFTAYEDESTKWEDWDLGHEEDFAQKRRQYCDYKDDLLSLIDSVPSFDFPETYYTTEEVMTYQRILENHTSTKYDYGFNPELGDKTLFKVSYKRDTLPRTERIPRT